MEYQLSMAFNNTLSMEGLELQKNVKSPTIHDLSSMAYQLSMALNNTLPMDGLELQIVLEFKLSLNYNSKGPWSKGP